ncbi:MAG: M20/M25/M40 family metallo-hydrolase [Fimbriimonadaceae bacterium]|nr:M20/M25/M40 family metallo-hydrolase [Fimbriimonadaceae bacterium]
MLRTRTFSVAASLLLAVTSFAQAGMERAPNGAPIGGITQNQLRAYLKFVADDLMEGRDTPSRGLDVTALFIASLCERWGLEPGGDNGTYFQKIQLDARSVNPEGTILSIGENEFDFGDEMIAEPTSGSGEGELVFVGNGIKVKDGEDPYAGMDLKGKIIVALSGAGPRGLQGRAGTDYWTATDMARQSEALAVIYLDRNAGSQFWNRRAQQYQNGRATPANPDASASVPVFYAGANVAGAILGEAANNVMTQTPAEDAMKSRTLTSMKAKFRVEANSNTQVTQNVIAIFPGSDPVLKNEYVMTGAHYDHVGMRVTTDGSDGIWNGADDDGSGTVTLLAMAEAASRSGVRPRRSIAFIWHCGEEKGLWGSQYFTQHPTIPLDRVKAMLNIDMIGRSKEGSPDNPRNADLSPRGSIYMIGPKAFSPELDTLIRRVNDQTMRLNLDPRYDDRNDPNRFWQRSDHVHYANAGIPIAFFFSGVHEDYHQASDEVSRIDFGQMEMVARMIFASIWEVAVKDTLHSP